MVLRLSLDVLLVLIKMQSETFHTPDSTYAAEHNLTWDESVHGFDGPVQASYAPYDFPGAGEIDCVATKSQVLTRL